MGIVATTTTVYCNTINGQVYKTSLGSKCVSRGQRPYNTGTDLYKHAAPKLARSDVTGEKDKNGDKELLLRSCRKLYEIKEGDDHHFVSPGQHVDTFFGNEKNEGRKIERDETSDLKEKKKRKN